jgi:tetratricopeptide (TPR) repeat protein
MGNLSTLKGRYELKEVLGQGGMGVVRRAYDTVLKCDVAVKMIRDTPDPAALQMFNRECGVLASLNHPNIIQILDQGEFEEDGHTKPYFVMPLLPGKTLEKLIEAGPLPTERCLDILTQVCRGLAAAHDQNLIHRDLKPSNIFIMPDDSVEIIDFGLCRMASGLTSQGQKGTLAYMAPELIEMKPPSPLSDVFALGVIAYQMFSSRRPFDGSSEREIADAILNDIPRPLSEVNAGVSAALGRVVHKAMAKQPRHRFGTAKEFAECLKKAYNNEPIEYFDPVRIRPRVEKARKAFGQGDCQFAAEIVGELAAEGHQDPDIAQIHSQITIAVRKERMTQLLESAYTRLEEEEYPLALQKVEEALSLELGNAKALELKALIERTARDKQMEGWFRLARQRIEKGAFGFARDALGNVLQACPGDANAAQLLREVEQLEREECDRKEIDLLYQSAMEQYRNGEVSAALGKLERLLDLGRKAPHRTGSNHSDDYQNFYNEVRAEDDSVRNDYEQAKRHLEASDFPQALEVCRKVLGKYPSNSQFLALKFDIEQRRRQALSVFVVEVTLRVDKEPDLQQKLKILDEAHALCPEEIRFVNSARLLREQLLLMAGIASEAKTHEDGGQVTEALARSDSTKTIYGPYPGLEFEIEQVKKRREEQMLEEAKVRWVEQIHSSLELGEFAKALEIARNGLQKFPGDAPLIELEKIARKGGEAQAQKITQEAHERFKRGESEEGIAALRQAHTLDAQNAGIRTELAGKLAEKARSLMESDLRAAEETLRQALEVDPSNRVARSVHSLLEDRKREEFLGRSLADIRQLQAAGNLERARRSVDRALAVIPHEPRLLRLKESLRTTVEGDLAIARRRDLEELKNLASWKGSTEPAAVQQLLNQMLRLAGKHPHDVEFQAEIEAFERREKEERETSSFPLQATLNSPAGPDSPTKQATIHDTPVNPDPRGGLSAVATEIFHSGNLPPMAIPVITENREVLASVPASPDDWKSVSQQSPLEKLLGLATVGGAIEKLKNLFLMLPEVARQVILATCIVILALVVVALGIRVYVKAHKLPRLPVADVTFQIHTDPPGALIFLHSDSLGADGSYLHLKPGRYDLTAQKEGYAVETFSVILTAAGAAYNNPVRLRPIRLDLVISTRFQTGHVFLDGMDTSMISADGQVTVPVLQPGSHQIRVESNRDNATFDFDFQPGSAPQPANLKTSAGLDGVILSVLKDQVLIESSLGDAAFRIDEDAPEKLHNGHATRSGLALGAHSVTLGEKDREWPSSFESSTVPRFTLSLLSLTTSGLLAVEVSSPAGAKISAHVSINKTDWGVVAGSFQHSVPPGDYDVMISQPGFTASPEHATATVSKGGLATLKFKLTRIVAIVAPPPLPPPPPVTRQVSHVRIEVSPSSATVEYRRTDELNAKPITNAAFEIDPGDYLFSARAQGFLPISAKPVHVTAGTDSVVVLALSPEPVRVALPPSPITHIMNVTDWESSWQMELDDWFIKNGGDYLLYKITPTLGEFHFSVKPNSRLGKLPLLQQKVRWVIGFKDKRNFVEMDIGPKSYHRKERRDGKDRGNIELKAERKIEIFEMRMIVQEAAVTVDLNENGKWTRVDRFEVKDSLLSEGRFGFADSLKLKDFVFTQRPPDK